MITDHTGCSADVTDFCGIELLDDVQRRVTNAHAERLDYHLRGAWRAGYDYVHIYDPIPGALGVTMYVYPSHEPSRPDPPDLRYRHTYDLTSVPDDVIRRAIAGID